MSMIDEFKKFALRGNVLDLAIGVIIGAAFSRIVNSVVADIFMPIIGAVTGGLDFSNYFVALSSDVTATSVEAAREQGAVIAYGSFITATINFLIVAWILFIVVKAINRLRAREDAKVQAEPSAPEVPADIKLLAEIRDLLAKNGSPATPDTATATGHAPGPKA